MVSLAQRVVSVDTEPLGVKSLLPMKKMAEHSEQWAQQYRDTGALNSWTTSENIIRTVVANYPGEFDASWDRKFLDAGAYE